MGAWGPAVFEHDAALDWIDELRTGPIESVRHADAVSCCESHDNVGSRRVRCRAGRCGDRGRRFGAPVSRASRCCLRMAADEEPLPKCDTNWSCLQGDPTNRLRIRTRRIVERRTGWNAGIRRLQDRLTDTSKHQRASASHSPKSKAAKPQSAPQKEVYRWLRSGRSSVPARADWQWSNDGRTFSA